MNDSPGGTPPGWGRARADSGGGQGQGSGGWGPGGGWGGFQQPQAPQPGVVPLRPLSVGEILDGAFSAARRHWRTALGVSFVVAASTQAVGTVVTGLWLRNLPDVSDLDETTPVREWLDAVVKDLGGTAVMALVGLVGSVFAAAMLTFVVSRAVLGRPVTAREAWARTRPHLGSMAGLFCLMPLLVGGVFAVGLLPGGLIVASGAEGPGLLALAAGAIAAIVLAAWLWVRYSLAAPALVLEKQGAIASMRRSAKLVRGSGWRILGIQLLATLLVFMIGTVVQVPATIIGLFTSVDLENLSGGFQSGSMSWSYLIISGISATISSTIALPITSGVTALLYMDQRIRRESLDIELARAAAEGEQ
ncbi:glycerophosphoryl diester phosphodiesterase membrane domain-containing protein [Streptomyces triculaminicus]|uniref:glycerophosphoryl diester phosphodiesterase membrane domain-containing protein n=1 Tax=Streptomyces triculaminicus TaxID=2816232 RepID=UPI0033F0BC8B